MKWCNKCRRWTDADACPICHKPTADKPAPNDNRCIVCGAIIPEGRHICLTCERTNEMQTFKGLTTPESVKADAVNHPAHYQGAHECIDEMLALFGVEAVKGFCMCNVYKYRYRADRKNGSEDIAKADWYMSKLMELEDVKK